MAQNINTQLDEVTEQLAQGISMLIRSLDSVNQRVDALNNLTNKPNIQTLKLVKNKALLNQDFETCEALKIYAQTRNIEI
ncbi:hypothetical protein [Sphingobacterium siyangense]|uniref:hypothetical protein n=1 Tax=Sphingobacterium siyangense TaxID=459529 RepID=UPI0028AB2553|nr:hypothetical protein [Sphingobacterium siyangense]